MLKKRVIRIVGTVAYIPLTKGYEAVIDAVDVSLVDGQNWHARVWRHTVYGHRTVRGADGRKQSVVLHRVILNAPDGIEVDHIDMDGLNNQRSNLRLATRQQNRCNQRKYRNNTSGFKGVTWDKQYGKWLSQIQVNWKTINLGRFTSEHDAHDAYARASAELHGAFGRAV